MGKSISYFGKSWSEIQRLRRAKRAEIAWTETERRLEKEHKAWRDYCARANAEYDALMVKTKKLMETSKKLSQQVTSKLT